MKLDLRAGEAKIGIMRGALVAFAVLVCAACAKPRDAQVAGGPSLDRDLREWVTLKSIAPQCEEKPTVVQRCGLVRDPWLFDERYSYAVRSDVTEVCAADADEACELAWMKSHNDHVFEAATRTQAQRKKSPEPRRDTGSSAAVAGIGIAVTVVGAAALGLVATKTLWSK